MEFEKVDKKVIWSLHTLKVLILQFARKVVQPTLPRLPIWRLLQ
jgi:hypothetical protein